MARWPVQLPVHWNHCCVSWEKHSSFETETSRAAEPNVVGVGDKNCTKRSLGVIMRATNSLSIPLIPRLVNLAMGETAIKWILI